MSMATQNTGSMVGVGASGVTRAGADKYPNPFFDIASEYVPNDINAIFELCTPAGTAVETDQYGHISNVEVLTPGRQVLSDGCRISVIEKTKDRHVSENLITVKSAGLHDPLRITGEHPLLVWDGKSFHDCGTRVLRFVPANAVRPGMYTVTQLPQYEVNSTFKFDPYLCGAYLAEGNILRREIAGEGLTPRAVRWTIGSGGLDYFDRICTGLLSVSGCKPVSRIPGARPDVRLVEATDPSFAAWMLANFGEFSHSKQIPDWVFHCSDEEKLAFIAGWLDGDGTFTYSGRFIGYSCNRQLIWQLFRLLASVGIITTIESHANRNPSDAEDTSCRIYQIAMRRCDAARFYGRTFKARALSTRIYKNRESGIVIDGCRLFRRVQRVGTVAFDDLVYNIRVRGTHSYTVDGVTCHNCEFLMTTMAPFKAVSERVVKYFLTEVVVEGEEDDEREKYEELFKTKLKMIDRLAEIGLNMQTYGNVFVSLYLPFDRMLICPKCGTNYHCETLDYKFKKGEFICECKKCGHNGVFDHKDRRSPDVNRVRLILWNPKTISLRTHPISGKTEYYVELDGQFCKKIQDGNPFFLNDTPWPMVETALRPSNQLFRFNPGSIYHLKTSSLAGLPIRGWGLPPLLPNFKLAYYIQLLRRYDEAITLDYVCPFRVLFPQAPSNSNQDALSVMNMGVFAAHMRQMVENHRKQLTDVQVAPFAIGYQMLGGEAKTLSPKDSIVQAFDELFTAMSYPADLYKGTLTLQAAPVALRLFEKDWCHLVTGYNEILEWVRSLIGRYFRWSDKIEVSLRPVTLADDLERKALLVQSAAGGDVSKQTAYRPMGIDYMEEQKRIINEQREIQRLQQKAQQDAATQPMDGSGGENSQMSTGYSPTDVRSQGEEIAKQIIGAPATQRRRILVDILHSNPTLHALVMQSLSQMRNEAASQGRASLEQGQG